MTAVSMEERLRVLTEFVAAAKGVAELLETLPEAEREALEGELERATAGVERDLAAADARRQGLPVCRVCSCTDEMACDGGCSWVEPDLCSGCVA